MKTLQVTDDIKHVIINGDPKDSSKPSTWAVANSATGRVQLIQTDVFGDKVNLHTSLDELKALVGAK